MRTRTGSIVKRKPRRKGARPSWWARVTYIDPKTGKRHDLQRRGGSKAHARDLLQGLLREIDATEGQGPLSERKTFAELCDYFEKHYVKAAEYVDGRKVAGVRSLGTAKGQLNVLRNYFGRAACVQSLMVTCVNFARPGSHTRRAQRPNEGLPASIASFLCCDVC